MNISALTKNNLELAIFCIDGFFGFALDDREQTDITKALLWHRNMQNKEKC